MHKFITFISGRGSNLDSICRSGLSPFMSCVITNNPEAPGIQIAKQYNIPVYIVNHKDFTSRQDFEKELSIIIDKFNPSLLVLAGFMRILSQWFINKYPNKIINIHPSILPAFVGTNAQRQALDYKVKTTGATVHFVTDKLDHGPIIASGIVGVKNNDTLDHLSARILKLEHVIYPFVIRKILDSKVRLLDNNTVEVLKDSNDEASLGEYTRKIHY